MIVHSAYATVTASHDNSGTGPASNTKSGGKTARWIAGGNLGEGVTLQWDMGSATPICSVYIEWEGASAHEYRVESSDDGESWIPRTTYTHPGSSANDGTVIAYNVRNLLPQGLVARYIRLYMVSPHNTHGYSIWYASVQGSAGPPLSPSPPPSPHPPNPPPADWNNPVSAGECVNGHGQTATVASGTSLTRCTKSITVDGTLIVQSNAYIETETIYVTPRGSVQIGTEASPVSNVTIYLNHEDCETMVTDRELNQGAYGSDLYDCLEKGQIKVEGSWHSYGVPKTAWTLLMSDCVNTGESTLEDHDCPDILDGSTLPHQNFRGCGCSQIHVEECKGWQEGDRIVIAYNLQRIPGGGTPRETKAHTISSITNHTGTDYAGCMVTLTAPTDVPHIGNNAYKTFENTLGDTITLRAEVMHMERSLHITGPMHWRQPDESTGGQGIATRAEGSGEVVMKWHRMTNCGRVLLGHYCHHFHHRHQAGGELTGAVIERSVSKGITIHGTSHVLVRSNNIWNHRGVGVYLEASITTLTQSRIQSPTLGVCVQNGAEHNNTVMSNVIGCATASYPGGRCSLADGVGTQSDADFHEQSGIYSLSMAGADLIGNHIFMMDNAFFVNQAPVGGWGKDIAEFKVTPKAMPLPRFEYNVFHDNSGFGWYANIHVPLQIEIDAMGYIADWKQTCAFDTTTGADHGAPGYVYHHIEYHNDFSMGSYHLGDTSSYNMTTVDGIKAQYWKVRIHVCCDLSDPPTLSVVVAQTYRRALSSGPIMEESVVRATVQAPGGQGLVEYKNVKWEAGHIDLNHHCALGTGELTGGVCASCYFINGGTGSARDTMTLVDEVSNRETSLVIEHGPLEVAFFSPNGHPVFTPRGDISCTQTAEAISAVGTYWWKCPSALKIRPLVIFSPNRGTITVTDTTAGHQTAPVQVPHRNTNIEPGAGPGYMYAPSGKTWAVGYTMLVRDGASLTIHVPDDVASSWPDNTWADYFVMQYSEANWPEAHQSSITVTVGGANAARYGMAGGPFVIHSTHSRSWLLPYGGMISASGAWYDAKKAAGEAATWEAVPSFLNASGYETERQAFIGGVTSWLQ